MTNSDLKTQLFNFFIRSQFNFRKIKIKRTKNIFFIKRKNPSVDQNLTDHKTLTEKRLKMLEKIK